MLGRILFAVAVAVFVWTVLTFLKRRQLVSAKRASRQFDNAFNLPSIVYFWSDGCHVCKNTQKRILEELLAEYGRERITLAAYNIDVDADAASKWGIRTLPTTVLLDSAGTIKHINSGLATTEKLRKQLDTLIF